MLNQYRAIYNATVEDMANSENEVAWNCSPMFIFGIMDKFMERLKKIKYTIEIKLTYAVLNRIRINGMDKFANQFYDAHQKIVSKSIAALDYQYMN